MPLPSYFVTDTELRTYPLLPERDPVAWQAIQRWCEAHDIDPRRVPMSNHIVRDEAGYRVEYDEFVFDQAGGIALDHADCAIVRRVVSQGEGPPLPFPALLVRDVLVEAVGS